MWPLPEGARYVNEKKYNLVGSGEFRSGTYYRLAVLASHLFAMVGMAGEVRYCPQDWAREQVDKSRLDNLPWAMELAVDDYPEVQAIEVRELAG
ncbi:MAG: hypothetical protein KJ060_20335 [Candidatus Hydrogenedentes bacterium]|nr:hypothetical protein [Candidatus Hydrogenedentota bacterium]